MMHIVNLELFGFELLLILDVPALESESLLCILPVLENLQQTCARMTIATAAEAGASL